MTPGIHIFVQDVCKCARSDTPPMLPGQPNEPGRLRTFPQGLVAGPGQKWPGPAPKLMTVVGEMVSTQSPGRPTITPAMLVSRLLALAGCQAPSSNQSYGSGASAYFPSTSSVEQLGEDVASPDPAKSIAAAQRRSSSGSAFPWTASSRPGQFYAETLTAISQMPGRLFLYGLPEL